MKHFNGSRWIAEGKYEGNWGEDHEEEEAVKVTQTDSRMAKQEERTEGREPAPEFCKP